MVEKSFWDLTLENLRKKYKKVAYLTKTRITNPFMQGKMVEPLKLKGNEKVNSFISNVYGGSGFNAKRLAEAGDLYSKMIEKEATICLTIAGAMTPIGMSGPIIEMMKKGFIDFIITTGANLYHDMHRPFDYPMVQGHFNTDDNELNKHGVARIYDVFIEDSETMLTTDAMIIKSVLDGFDRPISTADLHYKLGVEIMKTAPHPEKSILAMAAKYKVPIYTSSPGDSSIAMNLIVPHAYHKRIPLDPLLDVIETTAIVHASEKNGVVVIGGGSPKNFYFQTQPVLWQILNIEKGGHDYVVQLTIDSPHWGGLSGATPSEARSWGKIKDAHNNNVTVYSCASITYPLLCQFVNMNSTPRERKYLYLKKDDMTRDLVKKASRNIGLRDNDYEKLINFDKIRHRFKE